MPGITAGIKTAALSRCHKNTFPELLLQNIAVEQRELFHFLRGQCVEAVGSMSLRRCFYTQEKCKQLFSRQDTLSCMATFGKSFGRVIDASSSNKDVVVKVLSEFEQGGQHMFCCMDFFRGTYITIEARCIQMLA